MQTEVVRLIADALADPTTGVNAYLASVPRDAGDPVPPVVTVLDETRNAKAARQQDAGKDEPYTGPELVVALTDPASVAPAYTNETEAASLTVVIRYKARNAASAEAVRDAYYTMRTVRRSLAALRLAALGGPLRVRNGVQLVELMDVQHFPSMADVDEQVVTACVVTAQVRDHSPEW